VLPPLLSDKKEASFNLPQMAAEEASGRPVGPDGMGNAKGSRRLPPGKQKEPSVD
jgi:hypothetical protein